MNKYFLLEHFHVFLLLNEGFLCSGHSLDKLSNFKMMFLSGSGAKRSEDKSFEDHISTNYYYFGCIKI